MVFQFYIFVAKIYQKIDQTNEMFVTIYIWVTAINIEIINSKLASYFCFKNWKERKNVYSSLWWICQGNFQLFSFEFFRVFKSDLQNKIEVNFCKFKNVRISITISWTHLQCLLNFEIIQFFTCIDKSLE